MTDAESVEQTEALATRARGGHTPAAEEQAAVPERIGRYVVLRRLGAGAMGVVVTAYDPELDRQLAIKLIHPRVAERDDARARLLREAKGLARLSHPNVVQIHDAGTAHGRVFIAMELVDGQPLSRWREAAERSSDEILAVYVGAGRGLAAAHDAGLVHRDFKPDNVLVDHEGRARVLDFGLVRASDEGEAPKRPSVDPAMLIGTEPTLEVSLGIVGDELGDVLASSELELELTAGGQLMGTPAYMSPEQWKGTRVDARSDQFSFCVALWEALYGERPFAGRTVQALAAATMSGTIREPSSALRLSRRVRAALERGLRPDPAQRFESMHVLLRELEREDTARHSLALALGALAAFVLLAWAHYAGVTPVEAEAPSCDGAGAGVAEIWTPTRAEQIAEAFAKTEVPSREILDELRAGLDRYADRWRAAAEDNCAATHLRKSQSELLLDRRSRCLARRLDELDALLEVLGRADAATVDQALFAVESLPSLRACEPERVSLGEPSSPDDPALAARVAELRRRLVGAHASLDTGRYVEATERLGHIEAELETIDFRPLQTEFDLEYGRLLARIDRTDEAVGVYERAFFSATVLANDELAVRAAVGLTELEGGQRRRSDAARLWTAQARALLEREHGELPELAADLADVVSWNAYLEGKDEAAMAEATAGLAILDEAGLDAPMHRLALLLDRGAAEYSSGDLQGAEASFRAALELAEATIGRDNAKTTGALSNLAVTYSARGEFERARELLQESIATRERSLGPDNTSVGLGLSNLADVELELGHAEQALAAAERSHMILQASLGPEQYAAIIARQRLGLARALLGDYDEALLDLREVLRVAEAPPEPDPSLALELRANVAAVSIAAGLLDGGQSELAALVADDSGSWRELVTAGRYAAALGQTEVAETLLSVALERAGDPADAGSRRARALAMLALAKLLRERDAERAAELLGPELDEDLRNAPRFYAELLQLRRSLQ